MSRAPRFACLLVSVGFLLGQATADPGTAFQYQGRLTNSGAPMTGSVDFRFSLWNASSAGTQVGSTLTFPSVNVTAGLFRQQLDFGPVFDGTPLFLNIEVDGDGGANSFVALTPRRELTPVPYAQFGGGTGDGHSLNASDGSPVDAVFVDSDGDVGIGTLTPVQRLDVAGTAKIDGAAFITGNMRVDAGTFFVDSVNNRVGINNTSPAQPLDIVGNAQVDGTTLFVDAANNRVGVNTATPAQPLDVVGNAQVDGTTLFVDAANNRVGINNGAPGSTLHVTGAGTISQSLTVGAGLNVDTNTLRVDATNNRVGIGTASPAAGLHITAGPTGTLAQQAWVVSDPPTTLDGATDVWVDGNFAYVTTSQNRFLIFDISDGDDPIFVEEASLLDSPTSIIVSGRYAYVGDARGIMIWDVSDPANPFIAGELRDNSSGGSAQALDEVSDLFLQDNYLYVTTQGDNSLTIVDVGDRANPLEVGVLKDNGSGGTATFMNLPSGVRVAGSRAYVLSTVDDSMTVVDISNPAAPAQLNLLRDDSVGGSAQAMANPEGISAEGNIVYVTSPADDALTIISVSVGGNPSQVGTLLDNSSRFLEGACGVEVSGQYAYVVARDEHAISAINVSNPAAPSVVAALQDTSGGGTVTGLEQVGAVSAFAGRVCTITRLISFPATDYLCVFDSLATEALRVEGLATKNSGPFWSVFSDERLKEDITNLDHSLDFITRLHPVQFRYSNAWTTAFGTMPSTALQAGFLAQEYQQVFPQDVHTDPSTGYLQIDPSSTLPHLVGAIKEQQAEIERLRTERDAQHKAIEELTARLEALESESGRQ